MRGSKLHVARKARKDQEKVRWNKALEASRQGLDFEQALAITGMKPAGLKSMLYRKLRDTNWPIKEEK